MKKVIFISILFILSTVLIPTAAFAGEYRTSDYFADIGTKFGRGVWNVVSSPAEIPCTVKHEMGEGGAGGWTGFGLGSWHFVRRLLTGATEVVTFVIPMDKTLPRTCSNEPIDIT